MMVQITKIVAKSLEHQDEPSALPSDRPSQATKSSHAKSQVAPSKELDLLFNAGDQKKPKKKVEKIEFSDRLGSVFGVTEPRPSEDQNG
jgi:hypothetical protein